MTLTNLLRRDILRSTDKRVHRPMRSQEFFCALISNRISPTLFVSEEGPCYHKDSWTPWSVDHRALVIMRPFCVFGPER
jgi:hypothetical protein